MTEAPERIWATEDVKNYGEDRFHSAQQFRGGTEYVRAECAAVSSRVRSGHNYSQPTYQSDMDLWGEVKGEEVWESNPRKSTVLGPNGEPLEYARQPIGFDLRKRVRP